MPNEAAAAVHRINKLEVTDAARLTINSFQNEAAVMVTWQDTHEMPLSAMSANYPGDAYAWLVSPTGPFAGGQILDDMDDEAKELVRLKATVNSVRDAVIMGGCHVAGIGRFDTNEASLRNLLGTVQMATIHQSLNQPFVVEWRLADNSAAILTAEQVVAAGAAVMQFVSDCYQHSWALKAQMDAGDVVDIQMGWPAAAQLQ